MADGRRIPQSVSIEISSFCNRKCPWCPHSTHYRPPGTLPTQLIQKAICDLCVFDKYEGVVAFHRLNEPLLDPRIVELVEYARRKLPWARIAFASNGDKLTLDLWHSLRKAGLNDMLVTQYDGEVSPHVREIQEKISPEDKVALRVRTFRGSALCNGHRQCNNAGLLKSGVKLPRVRSCNRLRQVCIAYTGDAVLCCSDYLNQVRIGSVADRTIVDLHNDPVLDHYREELAKGNRAALKLCRDCDISN